MAKKQILTLVALLILQGFTQLMAANTKSSAASTTFKEWLATFDPSTAAASRLASCVGKTNGFYPYVEPETTCSDIYTACVFNVAYEQKCSNDGEVFDSTETVRKCVNRYDARSTACKYTVPAPGCNVNNVGEFQPIERCGDGYYFCKSPTGQPQFHFCSPGLPTQYFDPIKGSCQPTAGAKACEETTVEPEIPPVTVPVYGCGSDKINGFAYAITECSASYYTCQQSSTVAQSCNIYGSGKVFNYKATPGKPSSALCILKSTVPECSPNPSTAPTPSTTTPSTTTPSTTTPSATPPDGYCLTKPNGSYADEPDYCSINYRDCLGGYEYNKTCASGEVFDNAPTVKKCVNHYEAISDPCESTYPPPACTTSNVGLYMPVGRCSDLYYICSSSTASPSFKICTTGNYFSPITRTCSNKTGVVACQ